METINITQLKDIYKPLFDQVVIEFNIPGKTKSGIHLQGQAAKEHQMNTSPIMKVVAIGTKHDGTPLDGISVGDYVLPSPRFNPHQVPLVYKNAKEGLQHAQIHVSEIMGVVNTLFAKSLLSTETKETTIN